ncbi:MAG TPA: hypothetical protein PKK26_11240, partial [Candidatus Wallbacteria bacterium]|nr:hypothetical protein [Candidatus Wallbacteria bacterium]
CASKPVTGLSGNITTGWVQVRVKADAAGAGSLSSTSLSSIVPYTAVPPAPTAPVVNNTTDTFDWTNAALFTSISDYEFSKTNGASWTLCTVKPLAGMTGNITTGWVQVRVRSDAAGTGEAAGTALLSTASFSMTPDAPTAPVSNDKLNTFDWTNAPSYTSAANYEYSKDNASTWTSCVTKPITGISGNIVTGWVKVRVRANALGLGEPSGPPLSSQSSYTAFPAAPTDSIADNAANTFDWTNSALFNNVSDYEYSKNNGASWTVCTVKPQTGMSGNITAGWVKVRVKADAAGSGEAPSQALASVIPYNVTPATPTAPVVDDRLNTFDWTYTPNYTKESNYEFSKDNGVTWTICTTKPVPGISGDITSGWVKVRTGANRLGFSEPASGTLSSAGAYTSFPAPPTAPISNNDADTFDWTINPLYTSVSDYQYTKNNGASWSVCTAKPQTGMSGNITAGWVQVRIMANVAGNGEPSSAAIVSAAVYNVTPAPPTAPVVDDKLNTFNWTNNPAYANVSNYEFSPDNGVSWTVCTTKPLTGLSGNITSGWLQVRIIANMLGFDEPPSAALLSTANYTTPPPAPTGPISVDSFINTFDWTNVPSYTAVTDYEYTKNNGSSWTICTIKPQTGFWGIFTTGWVQVRVKANAGGTGEPAGATLSSTTGYAAP